MNDREEIREAFKTYYEGAEMGEEIDPARMYQIKGELDVSGIYLAEEVERFCAVYFKPKQRQSAADHMRWIRRIQWEPKQARQPEQSIPQAS